MRCPELTSRLVLPVESSGQNSDSCPGQSESCYQSLALMLVLTETRMMVVLGGCTVATTYALPTIQVQILLSCMLLLKCFKFVPTQHYYVYTFRY